MERNERNGSLNYSVDSELIPPPAEFISEDGEDIILPPPQYFQEDSVRVRTSGEIKSGIPISAGLLATPTSSLQHNRTTTGESSESSCSVNTNYNGSHTITSRNTKYSAVVTNDQLTSSSSAYISSAAYTSSNSAYTSSSNVKSVNILNADNSNGISSPDSLTSAEKSTRLSTTSAGSSSSWTDTISEGSHDTQEDMTSSVFVRRCSSEEVVNRSMSQTLSCSTSESASSLGSKQCSQGDSGVGERDEEHTQNKAKRRQMGRLYQLNLASSNTGNKAVTTSLTPSKLSPISSSVGSPASGNVKVVVVNRNEPSGNTVAQKPEVDSTSKEAENNSLSENNNDSTRKLAECSNLDRECDRLLMQECVQTSDDKGTKVTMRTTMSSSETKPHYRRSQVETSQEICRQLFPKDKQHEFFYGKDSTGRSGSRSGSLFTEFLDQKRAGAFTPKESTSARYDATETKTTSTSKTDSQRPRSLSGGFPIYTDEEKPKSEMTLYPIEVQVINSPKKPTASSVPVTPVSTTTDDSVKQSERKEELVTVERPLTFILPDGTSSRRRSQDQSGASLMRPYDPDISGSASSERGGSNTSAPVSPVLRPRPGSAAAPKRAPLATADSSSISSFHSRQSSMDSRFGLAPVSSSGLGLTSVSSLSHPHFVVVAIDFGTTYSGYAFSFTRDPDSIHMMRRWEGGDPGVVNQKTPTTLLLQPDGQFHSFGFTARDYYHDLDAQEAKKWLYFEKFKMTLHNNADLSKDTILKAANGKPFPALIVFSHALKFFKDHALQELSDQSSTTILAEDIRWVITVPAIWKAPAKQFMRQAAYQAGIASAEARGQLLIALEPEAASIYVRKLRLYQLVPDPGDRGDPSPSLSGRSAHREQTPDFLEATEDFCNDDSISSSNSTKYKTLPAGHYSSPGSLFPVSTTTTVGHEVDKEGTRYMVVDCGGGTVDITVYEMEATYGALKELHKATGGPYGSLGVDLEFEKLLVAIFGPEFIESFKQKRPAGWVDLMTAFESRKRTASPNKNNSLNVSLPFSFIDYYKKCKGGHVEVAIKKFGSKEVCWSSQGMLRLTTEAMRRLFQPTLDKIKQSIGDVLNCPTARDIQYMFLVGGFSESPILQREMRREFSHLLKIVIPQDVGLTILKGAVCFGLDPTVVCERRSRLTYGVGVLNRFIPSKHPQSKLVHKQGIDWCTDVFDKYVEVDQPVSLGDTVIRSYTPAKLGQKSSIIHIFCCDRPGVEYITDAGVRRCGTLCLDLTDVQYRAPPPGGASALKGRREIQTIMTFGDTEIRVTALDVATGKYVRSEIDFLNK